MPEKETLERAERDKREGKASHAGGHAANPRLATRAGRRAGLEQRAQGRFHFGIRHCARSQRPRLPQRIGLYM